MHENLSSQNRHLEEEGARCNRNCTLAYDTYQSLCNDVSTACETLLQKPDASANLAYIKLLAYDLQHMFYRQGFREISPYATIDETLAPNQRSEHQILKTYLDKRMSTETTDTRRYWYDLLVRLVDDKHIDAQTKCGLYIWMIHNAYPTRIRNILDEELFMSRVCAYQTPDWLGHFAMFPETDVTSFMQNISMASHRLYRSSRNTLRKTNTTILPTFQDFDAMMLYRVITRAYTLVYIGFIQGEIDQYLYQDGHSKDLLLLHRKVASLKSFIATL